jgi:hypothetical protein
LASWWNPRNAFGSTAEAVGVAMNRIERMSAFRTGFFGGNATFIGGPRAGLMAAVAVLFIPMPNRRDVINNGSAWVSHLVPGRTRIPATAPT